MIAGGVFRVKIFFRDTEYNHDIEYSQSTILYIQNEWVQAGCRQNELCTMTVELELLRPFSNGKNYLGHLVMELILMLKQQ